MGASVQETEPVHNRKKIRNQLKIDPTDLSTTIGIEQETMAKTENKVKENPKLEQNKLVDGRKPLSGVLSRSGRSSCFRRERHQVYYESGAMKGKP
jgi:DNA-binding XRE family transcriptional regulator